MKAAYKKGKMIVIRDSNLRKLNSDEIRIKVDACGICGTDLHENPDDALEIVKFAEQKKTIFYTSYMKRFIPAVEKAKELLPSLGRIISMHIRSYQPWGDLWEANPKDGFFHTPSGGRSMVKKTMAAVFSSAAAAICLTSYGLKQQRF